MPATASRTTPPTIGIVGAGASGTLAAIHLLSRARVPVRIVLIDRNLPPGRGVAYGTTDPQHLLNVRAGNMSALPDDPLHFAAWARSDSSDFVSRRVYAEYLAATLEAAQSEATPGVILDVRKGAVVDAKIYATALRLEADQSIRADRSVLALGNFPPGPLRLAGALDGFVRQDPWSPSALEGLEIDQPVLLVGTGLTMVDVVVSLIGTRGHRGQIYALSRRGQVPQIHADMGPDPTSPPDDLPMTTLGLLRRVRQMAAREDDWRSAVDGLRPVTQSTWQALPLAERERFVRHLQPYWDTHRHRIAPRIGRLICDARQSGQLTVVAGRLLGVDGSNVRVKPRHADERTLQVARVINCTGPAASLRGVQDPFVQRLLTRGLASPGLLDFGLRTLRDGRLVDAHGQPSARLFTLGPMRRGELWETIAVPDIRVQAANLAEVLLHELDAGPEHWRYPRQ
jgi:uncharacterized NAD(P)/FAD-binding protein YdhS